MSARLLLLFAVPLALMVVATTASAKTPAAARAKAPAAPSPDDPNAADARAAFLEGTALVEKASWAEALAAFERAAKLRSHAVTTYNIAACEKAMGRYTRAKITFKRALDENTLADNKQLPESLATDAKGYLDQIDHILAHVKLTVRPDGAAALVDGRPLAAPTGSNEASKTVLVAGIREPGPPEPLPATNFELEIDPGSHVFTFSRKGYGDQVVNRTFEPGQTDALELELDRLPATLHVASDRPGAIVYVDGTDLGPVPVDVRRAAGDYKIAVKKNGFVTYEASLALKPGEDTSLRAKLPEDKPALTQRWWFWAAAAVVVAGAGVATYAATRPTPDRAQVSGGSLGWKVSVP